MLHATFTRPDLTTFTRLDELGLQVVGQYLEPKRRCWRAGSSYRTSADGAAAKEHRGTA